jgi:hypothetical protein
VSTQPWDSAFFADDHISVDTIYTSQVVVDTVTTSFVGTINYKIETKTDNEHTTLFRGYIGQYVQVPDPGVVGYVIDFYTHVIIDDKTTEVIIKMKKV